MTTDDDIVEADNGSDEEGSREPWRFDPRKAVYGKVPQNEVELRPLAIANSIAMLLSATTTQSDHVSDLEWDRDAVYSAALVERWTRDFRTGRMVLAVDEWEELASESRSRGSERLPDLQEGEYVGEWVVGEFTINEDEPFVAVGVLQQNGLVRLLGPDELHDFNAEAGSPAHYRELKAEGEADERAERAADRFPALRDLGPEFVQRFIELDQQKFDALNELREQGEGPPEG